MSEQNSLYAKVHIDKEQLNKFLNAKITPITNIDKWMQWLKNMEYSGSIGQKDIESLTFYNCITNQDFFDIYFAATRIFPFQEYNTARKYWEVSILYFSENVFDYIRLMHIISTMAAYKSETVDFAIIYPFMWIENAKPQIQLIFDKHSITVNKEFKNELMDVAENHLTERRKILEEKYNNN